MFDEGTYPIPEAVTVSPNRVPVVGSVPLTRLLPYNFGGFEVVATYSSEPITHFDVQEGIAYLGLPASNRLAIIDVGGGSTELLVADDTALRLQHSFPLGTVRWLESFPVSDPPTAAERVKLAQALDDFLDEQFTPKLGGLVLPGTLIGAGGTPVFLSRILKERDDLAADEIESLRLSLPEVQLLTQRLWQMPLASRRKLAGLPANRADVILFGAAIYEAVMQRCGFGELRPTLRGVRYGALLD